MNHIAKVTMIASLVAVAYGFPVFFRFASIQGTQDKVFQMYACQTDKHTGNIGLNRNVIVLQLLCLGGRERERERVVLAPFFATDVFTRSTLKYHMLLLL
mmetsp:Transcript_15288/g.44388  ORF Transcript_15288/g.44388 Transcript_15288/m.44388 type:complete len:100 (-) Transcript_15288:36-335(-)